MIHFICFGFVRGGGGGGGGRDQYTNLDLLVQSAISAHKIHLISDQIPLNILSETVYHAHLWKFSFCLQVNKTIPWYIQSHTVRPVVGILASNKR